MLVPLEWESRMTRGKTSQSRKRTNKLNTHDAETGNRTQTTLVEGKSCHHCVNPVQSIIRVLTSDR